MSELLGWHFLCEDGTRSQDGVPIDPGATETWDGPLELCKSGLHFCVGPLDALTYAQGALLRRVRLSGNILQPDKSDKGCATVRTELWRADVTTLLHEFACDVAEQALDRVAAAGSSVDPRSREAIATKRRWLRGGATDEELAASGDAARAVAASAAWAASWAASAARAAAWSAAWAAAEVAPWATAETVARAASEAAAEAAAGVAASAASGDAAGAVIWGAAETAASDAAWATMNAELEQRLLVLPEGRE